MPPYSNDFIDEYESVMDRARRESGYQQAYAQQMAHMRQQLAQHMHTNLFQNEPLNIFREPPPYRVTKSVNRVIESVPLDKETSLTLLEHKGEYYIQFEQGTTKKSDLVLIKIKDKASAYSMFDLITRSVT